MSKSFSRLVAAAAAVSMSVPALANPRDAAFATSGDRPAIHGGMFAGASYRIALDGRTGPAQGEMRLKLAGHSYDPAQVRHRFGSGLEFGQGERGTAVLWIAGRPANLAAEAPDFERENTALIVLGVIVLVGGVLLILSSMPPGLPASE